MKMKITVTKKTRAKKPAGKGMKPDFLDQDGDGNRTEPMKAATKKKPAKKK